MVLSLQVLLASAGNLITYEVKVTACGACGITEQYFRTFTFNAEATSQGHSNFVFPAGGYGGLQFGQITGQLLSPANGYNRYQWDIHVVYNPTGTNIVSRDIRVEVDTKWDACDNYGSYLASPFVVKVSSVNPPPTPTQAYCSLLSAKVTSVNPRTQTCCTNNNPPVVVGDVHNCRNCGFDCTKITTQIYGRAPTYSVPIGYTQCGPTGCVCPNGQGTGNPTNCAKCGDKCASGICSQVPGGSVFACYGS